MKNFYKCIPVVFLISVLTLTQVSGQEWSEEQMEIWQASENWFELQTKNDAEGIKALIHKDFVGWGWGFYTTYGYTEMIKWADRMIPEGTESIYHTLNPMEILVINDVAVLYFYGSFIKTVDGKQTVEQGQFMNVWKKEDGQWLLIAGNGKFLSQN